MDHFLTDAPVRAADADVFVAAAEAALGVALEVGQDHHGIVIFQVGTHKHPGEPFAALDGEGVCALLVHDIHRAEGPAVDLQRLPVLLGGVAVSRIIGVGLHDGGIMDRALHQGPHPVPGDDVGAVLLAGVQLHRDFSANGSVYPRVDLFQALRGQIPGEEDQALPAAAGRIGYIFFPVASRYDF